MAVHNQKHLDNKDNFDIKIKSEPKEDRQDVDNHQFKAINLSQSSIQQDNKVSGERC